MSRHASTEQLPMWSSLWLVLVASCSPSQPVPGSSSTGVSTTPPATSPSAQPSTPAPAVTGRVDPPGPMLLLKGGVFKMGLDGVPGDIRLVIGPARMVKVPSFRIDRTEVTVAAYRACVKAGACSAPPAAGDASIWDFPSLDDFPISYVTWDDAKTYCAWVGKELPTEEMWEYAAAGRVGRDFPWGFGVPGHEWGAPDDLEARVNGDCFNRKSDPVRPWRWTCPVGVAPKGATPEGIQDLAGNAAEWTANVFCVHSEPNCGSELRTVRGGTSADNPLTNRTVWRRGRPPKERSATIGFRCAQRVEDDKKP